jgi:predicted amidohydrolase
MLFCHPGGNRVRVTLCQIASPDDESIQQRIERVGALVGGGAGSDLIVLPELWDIGYLSFDAYASAASALDRAPVVRAARDWASSTGAYVLAGSVVERDADGRFYNTTVLIDPRGELRHTYRKQHVFGYQSREAELLEPGRQATVAADVFGGFAATTCYDVRFPEVYRALVDRGARLLAIPAAWPAVRREHWRTLVRARAIENQLLVVAVNAAGVQSGVPLGGHSAVISPAGEVLLELGTDEAVASVDVELADVDRVRDEFPVLGDRRRDVIAGQLDAYDRSVLAGR